MKRLSDYAMDMREDAYHAKECLSYSILAQYERNGGFKWLPEKWSDLWLPTPKTEALIFGGAVDALLTDGVDEFSRRYKVVDIPAVQDRVKAVIDKMLIDGILMTDTDRLFAIIEEVGFYPTWRRDTRINKLTVDGMAYYEALKSCEGKTLLTGETYEKVLKVCDDLRSSKLISKLMFDKLPESQERFFQLKFATKFGGVLYKIMCDMIIVDHDKKTIHIYDLKTTGKESYSFPYSYLDWGYHIQSWLYRMVLEDAIIMTDYDDYKVDGFSFIVASKTSGEPCVWDDLTPPTGKKFRDPLVIGAEIVNSFDDDGNRKPMPEWCSTSKANAIRFE